MTTPLTAIDDFLTTLLWKGRICYFKTLQIRPFKAKVLSIDDVCQMLSGKIDLFNWVVFPLSLSMGRLGQNIPSWQIGADKTDRCVTFPGALCDLARVQCVLNKYTLVNIFYKVSVLLLFFKYWGRISQSWRLYLRVTMHSFSHLVYVEVFLVRSLFAKVGFKALGNNAGHDSQYKNIDQHKGKLN